MLAVGSQLWVGMAAVLGAGESLRVGAAVVAAVPRAGRAAAGALGSCGVVSSVPRKEQRQLSPSRERWLQYREWALEAHPDPCPELPPYPTHVQVPGDPAQLS